MSDALRDEIAAVNDVSRAQVCVGNGGDELLYNFLLAFGGRNRSVLICPPCFSEYAFFAQLTETNVRTAGRDPRTLTLDEEALLACARTCDLVIVTSPNNPTGDLADLGLIERVCHACHGLVMVDEAYIEFAGEDASALPPPRAPRQPRHPAHTLQGLRCGRDALRLRNGRHGHHRRALRRAPDLLRQRPHRQPRSP